jgi:hypothetical protein
MFLLCIIGNVQYFEGCILRLSQHFSEKVIGAVAKNCMVPPPPPARQQASTAFLAKKNIKFYFRTKHCTHKNSFVS